MRAVKYITACWLVVAATQLTAICEPHVAYADGRKPLLMDGKKTLFKKILTRPETTLAPQPEHSGKKMPPFSVLFVYGEKKIGTVNWLEVGPSRDGKVAGWVMESAVIPWRQAMTAAFTNPAGRDRSLMFRNKEELEKILVSADLLIQADKFREEIAKGSLPTDGPIVSVEPKNAIDLRSKFYLMPVLEAGEVYLDSGLPVTMVNVASISRPDDKAPPPSTDNSPPLPPGMPSDLRSAVVFVIDSTNSMGPYIARTKELMRRVYDHIGKAGLAEKVRFGIVAYRDSLEASPGLEYLAKIYADPNKVKDGEEFLKSVGGLKASTVSSEGFDEDALAGVSLAVKEIDWSKFSGRLIVLVTDAGTREGNDPRSSTRMAPAQMAQLAARDGISIFAMHLLTNAGAKNHKSAADQYKTLSRYQDGAHSNYYGVAEGEVNAFGEAVDSLAKSLVAQVERGPDINAQKAAVDEKRKAFNEAKTEKDKAKRELEYKAELIGLAIQLRYFGTKDGTAAPSVFNAWMTDRDFRDPNIPTLDVRVLLTKNQLSDLSEAMQRIITAGEAGQLSPQDFFGQLQSAAAAMGRDPDKIKSAATIAELGLIGEYLDGLPYRSKVMSVDKNLWLSWGVGQQQQFIDELRSKVSLYRRYHDEPAKWVLLAEGAQPGDAVYPIRLEELP